MVEFIVAGALLVVPPSAFIASRFGRAPPASV
jgi:hypothetical protein